MNLLTDGGLAAAGLHLRTIREFKGMTRKEAAERGSVSLSYLQKLETGKAGLPDPEKLQNYCMALGLVVKLDYKISFTVKEPEIMDNSTFLNIAEKFFFVAKESYTATTFTFDSSTAFTLNPEKNLFEQFLKFYADETLAEKKEAVAFDSLPDNEKPAVLASLKKEIAVTSDFKTALKEAI